MSDPTRDWSPTTRMAYQTTRRIILANLGEDTPIQTITRTQCREMIEIMRWQPRNASKLFPKLNPMEIAERAKTEGGRTSSTPPTSTPTSTSSAACSTGR